MQLLIPTCLLLLAVPPPDLSADMAASLNMTAKAYTATSSSLTIALDASILVGTSYESIKNAMTDGDRREFNAAYVAATGYLADAEDGRIAALVLIGKQADCWKLGQAASTVAEMNAWYSLGISYGNSAQAVCITANASISAGLSQLSTATTILSPYTK